MFCVVFLFVFCAVLLRYCVVFCVIALLLYCVIVFCFVFGVLGFRFCVLAFCVLFCVLWFFYFSDFGFVCAGKDVFTPAPRRNLFVGFRRI